MWYAKMYFSEGQEIVQYDSHGTQGVPDVRKEFAEWKAQQEQNKVKQD